MYGGGRRGAGTVVDPIQIEEQGTPEDQLLKVVVKAEEVAVV